MRYIDKVDVDNYNISSRNRIFEINNKRENIQQKLKKET